MATCVTWTCPLCSRAIYGRHGISRHQRAFWNGRCAVITAPIAATTVTATPIAAATVSVTPIATATVITEPMIPTAAVITTPSAVGVQELVRREPTPPSRLRQQRSQYTILQRDCNHVIGTLVAGVINAKVTVRSVLPPKCTVQQSNGCIRLPATTLRPSVKTLTTFWRSTAFIHVGNVVCSKNVSIKFWFASQDTPRYFRVSITETVSTALLFSCTVLLWKLFNRFPLLNHKNACWINGYLYLAKCGVTDALIIVTEPKKVYFRM